ncbi:hypothetical protein BX661DRAFT_181074 [Kickxella alabastrina]|uniref:uncharacterized protein n=1 Tax=Kickxella alabastrina TaxID=61397 RepID=UPI00221E8078|nr:uncharacterized protein BX661DRAFT_181074 [Kickxella alabastrina]KAI7830099.1 hypothetical protein BX661DRAFT_181074 [Kickxella alabastrina]
MPPSRTIHEQKMFKCSKCGRRDKHSMQHSPVTITSASGIRHVLQWSGGKIECPCGKQFAYTHMNDRHALVCSVLNATDTNAYPDTAGDFSIISSPSESALAALNLMVERESGLIICQTCCYMHLYKCQIKHGHLHHVEYSQRAVREACRYLLSKNSGAMSDDELQSWYKDRLLRLDLPIPGISAIDQAFWCEHCNYAVCDRSSMRKHYKSAHNAVWVSAGAAIGPVQQLSGSGNSQFSSYIRVLHT